LVKSEHLSSHEVNSRFSKLRWDNLPVINSKSNHIVTQQKDVYHRLLHKFISANLPALQLLEAGTMSEEKIFKLAHKLRGGSLSLGLEKLSELCLMFEEFSANKTKQHPSFDDLTRTLRQSIDTINSMLRDTTTKKVINNPSQDMTDEALTSCFKFGLKVLSSHSLQEVKPFLEQLQSYGLEQIYRDVEHQLDDFDFSGAARVIKTAAKVKGLDLD
jgi:HPt (histidine-containing phosphotransfer) domain-containing protein